MTTRRFLLGLACLLPLIFSGGARAEVPRKPPPPGDTLQAVLDRIHNHAAGEAWKEPGWKDDAIEAWLDKLVGSVAKAADLPDLKLPVRFVDVKASEPAMGRAFRGALIVGKDIALKNAPLQNCIVLADGTVEIGGADGCVIVARSTVTSTSITQRSLIVAGTLVKLSTDGRFNTNDAGSLVVSRGWVDTGRSAFGTIIAAREGIQATRFQGATFVNAAVPPARPERRAEAASRSVTADDLPLEGLQLHPLGAEIKLLGFLQGLATPEGFGNFIPPDSSASRTIGIVFRLDGRRYIAEFGKPIRDESGQLVERLRPWKVTDVVKSLAIFSGGNVDMAVHMGEK